MYNSNLVHWTVGLDAIDSNSSDLVFKSINNTQVIFTDNFTSGVLNFTGSHTCTPDKSLLKRKDDLIGMILISTGKYDNELSVDNAVPIVKLANNKNDQRCFGVISAFEENNKERNFKIGNLKFSQQKEENDIKVIVNGAGEGGIWICNLNGNLKNGDLITTSSIPGYGILQDDNIVKNYTVAKITCSCNFKLNSRKYKCEKFKYKKKWYKRAFVGCVYKF